MLDYLAFCFSEAALKHILSLSCHIICIEKAPRIVVYCLLEDNRQESNQRVSVLVALEICRKRKEGLPWVLQKFKFENSKHTHFGLH